MMRILHVIDHLGLGGAQSALLDIVANRDASCMHCEVAAMHGWGPFADALETQGVRVHSLSTSAANPVYIPRFLALVREGHYDILHFHLQGANWIAKPLAALSCDALRVSHDHASGDLRFRGMGSLVPDALAHLFSHHVIAVSPGVARFLTHFEALPAENVTVVPNGIDTRVFVPPTPDRRAEARRAWGLEEGDFCVGALGRLAPEKNFTILGRVARLLPGVKFLIGGEGPRRREIEAAFQAEGCGGQLRLLGVVTDRPSFFAALDAFVIPSFFEGLPMVLLEAMASGVPVVASRLPDLASVLGEGRFGRLADPNRAESMAEGLRLLRDDAGLRRSLASAARDHCAAKFSASASARQIESLYRTLFQPTAPLAERPPA